MDESVGNEGTKLSSCTILGLIVKENENNI